MLKKILKPELLAPAGDWNSLSAAINSGADSVYFGVRGINLRYYASNFEISEIKKIMSILHSSGKKGYLTLNTIIHEDDLDLVKRVLGEAKKAGIDAVICWDMAVIGMARALGLEIHISTQASSANIEAVKLFAELGAKRIVLARECNLKSITQIIKKLAEDKIKCGVEVFVHGAMCVSISGRCFLSQDAFMKSANEGKCLQPCRREYLIKETGSETEFIVGKDYILSPRDLCTIGFIDQLINAGISAFKIEGRMRPPEYVKVVTEAYREAIDAYMESKLTFELKQSLTEKLKGVYNRGFSDGFYFHVPSDLASKGPQNLARKIYSGRIEKYYKKIGVAEITIHDAAISINDRLIVMGKNAAPQWLTVESMEIDHKKVIKASKGQNVAIKFPFPVKEGDKIFQWEEH